MAGCSITETPSAEHDRALSPGEFDAVWLRYERYAQWLIRGALARAPLRDAHRFAGANGESTRLLAGFGTVRRTLATSDDLVEDALQEVALALFSAIQQGRIRAAAPVIEGWLRTTAPRIARDVARGRSVLLFAAGDPPPAERADDEGEERETSQGNASQEPDPAWLAETREIVTRIWDALPSVLKPREFAVLQGWLEDREHAEIARELGTTPGNTRVLLHRALEAVRAVVGEARAGPNWPRRPNCGLIDLFIGLLLTFCFLRAILFGSDIRPRPASWPLERLRPCRVPIASRVDVRYLLRCDTGVDTEQASEHSAKGTTMAMTHIARIDRSIYLGSSEDPQPIFRDEAADGASWPEGAALAVTFTKERFGHLACGDQLPRTDFFGGDGWPLDFDAGRKAILPDALKRGFQVHPWGWRRWDAWTWLRAQQCPLRFAQPRNLGPMGAGITRAASPSAP